VELSDILFTVSTIKGNGAKWLAAVFFKSETPVTVLDIVRCNYNVISDFKENLVIAAMWADYSICNFYFFHAEIPNEAGWLQSF